MQKDIFSTAMESINRFIHCEVLILYFVFQFMRMVFWPQLGLLGLIWGVKLYCERFPNMHKDGDGGIWQPNC